MSETEKLDVIEVIEPSAKNYEIVIGDRVFIQTPLSFYRKIELFSVLANAIDKALSEGALISEFFEDVPKSAAEFTDADIFVKSIAKVVKYSPEILSDIFCISLNVKRNEREEVKELLEEINDEQGLEIINNFIDQNWDAMMDFFSKQAKQVMEKVSQKIQSQSTLSKQSKASVARTQKK